MGGVCSALHSAVPTVPVCLGVVFSKQHRVFSAVSCHVTPHQSKNALPLKLQPVVGAALRSVDNPSSCLHHWEKKKKILS